MLILHCPRCGLTNRLRSLSLPGGVLPPGVSRARGARSSSNAHAPQMSRASRGRRATSQTMSVDRGGALPSARKGSESPGRPTALPAGQACRALAQQDPSRNQRSEPTRSSSHPWPAAEPLSPAAAGQPPSRAATYRGALDGRSRAPDVILTDLIATSRRCRPHRCTRVEITADAIAELRPRSFSRRRPRPWSCYRS